MIIFFMSQTRITYPNVYKPNVYVKENNDFLFLPRSLFLAYDIGQFGREFVGLG